MRFKSERSNPTLLVDLCVGQSLRLVYNSDNPSQPAEMLEILLLLLQNQAFLGNTSQFGGRMVTLIQS